MSEEYKNFLKKKFFGKKYSVNYDKWVEDPFTAMVERRQKKAFLELTEAKPGMKVLDIGAGTGKYELIYAKIMKKKGQVFVLDFSDEMLLKLRKNMKANKIGKFVKIVKGDAEKLPFKDNYFDEVLAMNTLQYIPNDEKFFSEVYRVLKKDKVALIDALSITELRFGHNLAYCWDKVRRIFKKKPLGIYKQFYTTSSIRKKLKKYGLIQEQQLGVILVLPWITKEHVGITLPSPHHIFVLFPKLLPIMEIIEEKIKKTPLLRGLCTHLMIKARKKDVN